MGQKLEKRGMDKNVGRRRAAAPMIGEMFLLLFILIYLVFLMETPFFNMFEFWIIDVPKKGPSHERHIVSTTHSSVLPYCKEFIILTKKLIFKWKLYKCYFKSKYGIAWNLLSREKKLQSPPMSNMAHDLIVDICNAVI